ncbi:MAG: sigma-70 family RNA polymerase sigma factor, partial [Bacteroidota bacterium]
DFLRHLKVERKTHGRIRYSQKIEELLPNEIIDAEVFIVLARLIEQLPGKCRKIFELIYYNNMTTSEIAQEMGITNQNVLNQKARAIHILRSGLMQKSF